MRTNKYTVADIPCRKQIQKAFNDMPNKYRAITVRCDIMEAIQQYLRDLDRIKQSYEYDRARINGLIKLHIDDLRRKMFKEEK